MMDLPALPIAGLSPAEIAFAMLAVCGAAFLRGYSGFGFALAAVPGLTLVAEPAAVVPTVLLLEILAGLQLLPDIRRSVDWYALRWLAAGALPGVPLGVYLLAALPADAMRAAIGGVVLVAVLLFAHGFRLEQLPTWPARLGIGALSGVLSGGAAMAGPPVILFFLASPVSAAVSRASLLAFFLFASSASAILALAGGLIGAQTLVLTALLAPALFLGNALGHRGFGRSNPRTYRRVALVVLAAIAAVAIGRAVAGWAA